MARNEEQPDQDSIAEKKAAERRRFVGRMDCLVVSSSRKKNKQEERMAPRR